MMLQGVLLLIFSLLAEGGGNALPPTTTSLPHDGSQFTQRLCATNEGTFNLFGHSIKTETCTSKGYNTSTDRLYDTPHWCCQDNINVTKGSTTNWIPSGCSLYVKDEDDDTLMDEIDCVDKIGLVKLGQVSSTQQINFTEGIVESKGCDSGVEGLNSGSHDLQGKDYWCRNQTISLPFVRDDHVPSGCSCYIR